MKVFKRQLSSSEDADSSIGQLTRIISLPKIVGEGSRTRGIILCIPIFGNQRERLTIVVILLRAVINIQAVFVLCVRLLQTKLLLVQAVLDKEDFRHFQASNCVGQLENFSRYFLFTNFHSSCSASNLFYMLSKILFVYNFFPSHFTKIF